MKKLTDFQLAALSAVPSMVGGFIASATDVVWAIMDYGHMPLSHHLPVALTLSTTLPLFVYSAYLLVKAWKAHKMTGHKMVQSEDDIDYRIQLYMIRTRFNNYCAKEKALTKRR